MPNEMAQNILPNGSQVQSCRTNASDKNNHHPQIRQPHLEHIIKATAPPGCMNKTDVTNEQITASGQSTLKKKG